jgi:nucleotide-binding universal stress UspA family protein
MQPARFGTILCPVDFSDLSGHALRHAARLAACGSAKLVTVYANWFDAPPYFTAGRIEELKKEFRDSQAEAERSLAAFVKSTLGERAAAVEIRVAEGLPADVILGLAASAGAGLIVMGTHGRTGYNRWMMGSVAERVLRESPVPLLTVRGPSAEPIRRILCPVDDTGASREALSVAAELAGCLGATLTALHVREPHANTAPPDLCSWMPAEESARCEVRVVARHGDAASEIIGFAAEESFDLLVLGSPRRKFFDGLVLGTTTLRTVRHASCPVLTVRARAR